MKRALKDNQEAFAGQEFYVGIDVHQKQWTISIQSNQIALAKPLTLDPSARSWVEFPIHHCIQNKVCQRRLLLLLLQAKPMALIGSCMTTKPLRL